MNPLVAQINLWEFGDNFAPLKQIRVEPAQPESVGKV